MYLPYFKLKEFPFSLVSDPAYIYLSANHGKVMSFIKYALTVQDSFLVITGEVGTGKTTMANYALQQCDPHKKLINIQALKFSSEEFLQYVLAEVGIEAYGFSKVQMLEKLKQYLTNQQQHGKKTYLIIDEAQNLDKTVLEDVRFLSDLEHRRNKLLNIVLVGQPELNKTLDEADMEHFLQRIRLRTHIRPLERDEIEDYIKYRLQVAGARRTDLFEPESMQDIYQFTGGRLRLVNTLCDYALMYCCVENMDRVSPAVVQKAANELQWKPYTSRFGQNKDLTQFRIKETEPTGRPQLILMLSGNRISEHSFDKGSLTIGRDPVNDITLDGEKISRQHAQVFVQGEDYYLHDLGSTNGTLVNGQKVKVHTMQDGDVVAIDKYELHFIAPEMANTAQLFPMLREIKGGREDDNTRIFPKKEHTRRFFTNIRKPEKENF